MADLFERNIKIFALALSGHTQAAIGRRFNLGQSTVSQINEDVRATLPKRTREQIAADELAFLQHLRTEAMEIVHGKPVPLYSAGRPVLDEAGGMVQDHSGRFAAMDRAIKLHERVARLCGLDSPQRQQIEVSNAAQQAAAAAAVDALGFLNPEPPDVE